MYTITKNKTGNADLHHLTLDLHAKVLDSWVRGDLGLVIDAFLNPLHTVLHITASSSTTVRCAAHTTIYFVHN